MTRMLGSLVLAGVAFFATSNLTKTVLSGNSKVENAGTSKGRVPSSVQKAIDRSNAELQSKIDDIHRRNREFAQIGTKISQGSLAAKKSRRKSYGNSYTQRGTPVNRPTKRRPTGNVSSNPYAN